MRRIVFALFLTTCLLSAGFSLTGAEASIADVQEALVSLSLANSGEIMEAFTLGMSQGNLEPAEALHLIDRLTVRDADPEDTEGILLSIAQAIQDGLPVTMLIEKAEEGLARNVPLSIILNGANGQPRILGLSQRAYMLGAVRDLLYSKGIFSCPSGAQPVSQSIPVGRFNTLVNETADCLADYVEAGGSPLEGHLMYQQVNGRLADLSNLTAPAILPEDARLAMDRITPADLTTIVLKIFE